MDRQTYNVVELKWNSNKNTLVEKASEICWVQGAGDVAEVGY